MPRRQFLRCNGSKVTIFYGMVRFATGLTGWVDSSGRCVISMVCVVIMTNIGWFVVRVEVWSTLDFIVVVNSTFFYIFYLNLVFFSFELPPFILVVPWLFCSGGMSPWFPFVFLACCVAVFICNSSVAPKQFSSNSFPRCHAICSKVPFFKCAWFMLFLRYGGVLTYMSCSMSAWPATSTRFFAKF